MKLKLLILVLALQTAWILATTFSQERGLAAGTLISLETMPVDPRDLLRGDYVVLNYKISTVPSALFSPPITKDLSSGETVYVVLEKRGQFHEVARTSTTPIELGPGQVMLKGRAEFRWGPSPSTVRVLYGLERYYVREGTGNPRGKLTVQAAVTPSGEARLKQVFVDGKPYADVIKPESP